MLTFISRFKARRCSTLSCDARGVRIADQSTKHSVLVCFGFVCALGRGGGERMYIYIFIAIPDFYHFYFCVIV